MMNERLMELWSDDLFSEFAIKFNFALVVQTSSDPDVTVKMVDQRPFKLGYDFDWNYTLSQWVIYYLANKYIVSPDSKFSKQKDFKIQDEEHDEDDVSLYTRVDHKIKVKNKPPPKPGLKCHFCNLKYCLEEERNEHEEFWHSKRLMRL
jgi:hypothetical protein